MGESWGRRKRPTEGPDDGEGMGFVSFRVSGRGVRAFPFFFKQWGGVRKSVRGDGNGLDGKGDYDGIRNDSHQSNLLPPRNVLGPGRRVQARLREL